MINERLLIGYLEGQPGRRATFKHLLQEFRARGPERQRLQDALSELVRQGRLFERKGGYEMQPKTHGQPAPHPQVSTPPPARADLRGRISLHRDGYGFVTPEAAATGTFGAPTGPGGDIFIPPPATGGAMHGDIVAVRFKPSAGERREGQVVGIITRAHTSLIGLVRRDPRGWYLQPLDDRIRAVVRLDDAPPDANGQVAEVAMIRFPTASLPGQGRVLELLGRRDDFGVDVEIIIRKHHLPRVFPDPVQSEAAALPSAPSELDLAGRRDFRSLPVVTIDGESARDFDDAVLVSRLPNGNFELQVHIADVAHYVQPGSPLDTEARLRGTSVYFPDRAVPMLPHELSSGLCSLKPDEDRLVMSCLMEINPQGEIVAHELAPGVIHSAARMTYTKVHAILEHDSALRAEYAPLVEGFERMAELQAVLFAKRQRRGSIDFDLPEPEIAFDEQGTMRSIVKSERNIAHRLIEEFMLAAAETVARHVQATGIASVYRIHEQPDLKKVADFEQTAAQFGFSLGTGPLPIARHRIAGRIVEVPQPAKFRISPRQYQTLAKRIAGKPEERILSFLMLRSLKQARYSAHNVGHFALATDCYTHFTSPIRRYPDLMLHRIVKSLLGVDVAKLPAALASTDGIEPLCQAASDAERRADEAERELMDWKKVRFMESRVGEQFPALILHCTREGFFVELLDQFIEGFVPADTLTDDLYFYRSTTQEWVGERSRRRFRLGDRLDVLVERIDPVRMQIHFAPVSKPSKPASPAKPSKPRKPSKPTTPSGPRPRPAHARNSGRRPSRHT